MRILAKFYKLTKFFNFILWVITTHGVAWYLQSEVAGSYKNLQPTRNYSQVVTKVIKFFASGNYVGTISQLINIRKLSSKLWGDVHKLKTNNFEQFSFRTSVQVVSERSLIKLQEIFIKIFYVLVFLTRFFAETLHLKLHYNPIKNSHHFRTHSKSFPREISH